MARCLVRSVALLVFLSLLSMPAVPGNPGGYTVVPVSPDMLSGTPHDPVPVSFWDLSPRVMAIGIVLSFFPVLLFPVETVWFLKIFAWFGYRRLSCDPTLRNGNRIRIYEVIRENPGITLPAISHMTGITRPTIRHHLATLSDHGKITAVPTRYMTFFFDNCGQFSEFEKHMIIHLRNGTTRVILEIIADCPGISRCAVAGRVGIAGSSVAWHADRLFREGIITAAKDGREMCYSLTTDAAAFFQRYYRQYPVPVSVSPEAVVN